MLCVATKRGWRQRCLLSSIIAVLLLAPVVEAYMSTMHLGRTIRSLRARLEEQQQQEDQQRQHQQLPPGLDASPSPDQPDVRRDTDGEVAQDGAELEAAADGTAVATHPSWGSPADNGGEEPAGPTEGHPASTAGDDPEGGSKHAEGLDAANSVYTSREEHGLLKEQEDPTDRRAKLSTPTVTAAASAAAAAAGAGAGIGGISSRQATPDADVSARFSKEQVREAEENQSVSSGAVQSGLGTATTGDRGVVGTAAAAGILGASGTTPAEKEPVGVSKKGVETSGTSLHETEATAASAAAAAAGAAQDGDQVNVTKEEREEEEGVHEEAHGEGVMEEELEAAAIREILDLRSAQDREVQLAAARAVEALPPTQRECFEDVKAFAFGGAVEGEPQRQ